MRSMSLLAIKRDGRVWEIDGWQRDSAVNGAAEQAAVRWIGLTCSLSGHFQLRHLGDLGHEFGPPFRPILSLPDTGRAQPRQVVVRHPPGARRRDFSPTQPMAHGHCKTSAVSRGWRHVHYAEKPNGAYGHDVRGHGAFEHAPPRGSFSASDSSTLARCNRSMKGMNASYGRPRGSPSATSILIMPLVKSG